MKYLFMFEDEELGVPFSMEIIEVKPHQAPFEVLEEGDEYVCILAMPLYKFRKAFEKLIKKQ